MNRVRFADASRAMRLLQGLYRHRADTRPDHDDPRLRGRTYPVPFAAVWQAIGETAAAMPRWTVVAEDPRAGTLTVEARTAVWKLAGDVEVTVALDEEGQTRVDVRSESRARRGDLGANARRIARFLHEVDLRLGRRGS